MIRVPDRYAQNIPERHRKKWEKILLAFMQGNLDRLASIQRTGSRGCTKASARDSLFPMPKWQESTASTINWKRKEKRIWSRNSRY